METRPILPYGLASFEEMATGNYYYVDKTMFIERLERVKFPVFLRPRRFGKSLFTEMLRCYYDLRMAGRFQEIFGGLHAGRNPTPNRNRFFFLGLDFSGMGGYSDMGEAELKKAFDAHVASSLFGFLLRYRAELELDAAEVRRLAGAFESDAARAMSKVCQLVQGAGGRLYLAIDEYDSLTNALAVRYRHTGPDDNLYLRVLSRGGFLRGFFEALKANAKSAIHQIYITGILPITLSDLHSGFNIANWIQLSEDFSDMLGITHPEFDLLLDRVYADYPGIPLPKEELAEVAREHYDGYRFTPRGQKLYNPLMAIHLLDSVLRDGRLPDQLADNNLRVSFPQVAFIFGQNTQGARVVVDEVAGTGRLAFSSRLQVAFDMEDFKLGRMIPEGLFYLGMLTFSEELGMLGVPNMLTYGFAVDHFARLRDFDLRPGEYSRWVVPYKAHGDVEALLRGFFAEVIERFPGQFFAHANESFFHGLLYHVLDQHFERDLYELSAEMNLPHSRADIVLRSYPGADRAPTPLADVFEIKRVHKEASDAELRQGFEDCAEQARRHRSGPFAAFRAVAVCFRGNKDFLFGVF